MYAILILAAGSSSRLGTPKQALAFRGTTLLEYGIRQAIAVPEAITFVVIHNKMQLPHQNKVQVVVNDEPTEGMAASVRAGIDSLVRLRPGIEACLIMVCDQPFISTELLQQLIDQRVKTGKGIIASAYGNDQKGTPALFDKKYFNALLALKGDTGARKLLTQYKNDLATVPFPDGRTDIDTQEDYLQLMQAEQNRGRNDQR